MYISNVTMMASHEAYRVLIMMQSQVIRPIHQLIPRLPYNMHTTQANSRLIRMMPHVSKEEKKSIACVQEASDGSGHRKYHGCKTAAKLAFTKKKKQKELNNNLRRAPTENMYIYGLLLLPRARAPLLLSERSITPKLVDRSWRTTVTVQRVCCCCCSRTPHHTP